MAFAAALWVTGGSVCPSPSVEQNNLSYHDGVIAHSNWGVAQRVTRRCRRRRGVDTGLRKAAASDNFISQRTTS